MHISKYWKIAYNLVLCFGWEMVVVLLLTVFCHLQMF